jgi:hypothetical protein
MGVPLPMFSENSMIDVSDMLALDSTLVYE